MKRCLDDAMLQSYFDGELSKELMESATLHMASCATCAAAARELEQENALLSEAFGFEFEESIPTERLRRRIDAAIAGLQVVRPVHQPSAISSFFSSVSSLFSFSPQRTFGYAALMLLLAFGAILGWVKFKSSAPTSKDQVATYVPSPGPAPVIDNSGSPANNPANNIEPVIHPVTTDKTETAPRVMKVANRPAVPKIASPLPSPVKLLPGERAYLQTIAKLDSTIKDDKNNMRPALQAEYERNLAVVDRAIAATRTAAKKNPNDPDAADFMFAAYQSKVDLLNTIADARVYNRTH